MRHTKTTRDRERQRSQPNHDEAVNTAPNRPIAQQRLVVRYPLSPPLPASWTPLPDRRRLLRLRPTRSIAAEIRDISLLGAHIVINERLDLARGDRAQLSCHSSEALVRVRHTQLLNDTTQVGADFIDAEGLLGGLQDFIARLRIRQTPIDLENWWNRSK